MPRNLQPTNTPWLQSHCTQNFSRSINPISCWVFFLPALDAEKIRRDHGSPGPIDRTAGFSPADFHVSRFRLSQTALGTAENSLVVPERPETFAFARIWEQTSSLDLLTADRHGTARPGAADLVLYRTDPVLGPMFM